MRRRQRVLRGHLLFDNALLDKILTSGVAEGDNSTCKTVRMVLSLQLHFLLLVHLDGVQTVLIQVW